MCGMLGGQRCSLSWWLAASFHDLALGTLWWADLLEAVFESSTLEVQNLVRFSTCAFDVSCPTLPWLELLKLPTKSSGLCTEDCPLQVFGYGEGPLSWSSWFRDLRRHSSGTRDRLACFSVPASPSELASGSSHLNHAKFRIYRRLKPAMCNHTRLKSGCAPATYA